MKPLLLAAVFLLVAGCLSAPPVDVTEIEAGKKILSSWKNPIPLKVGLCIRKPGAETCEALTDDTWRVLVRDGTVRESFLGSLSKFRIFEAIVPVSVGVGASDAECLQAAASAGAQVLLLLDVEEGRTTYVGRNVWWIWNMLVWGLGIAPAWWIPDETYRLDVDLNARLIDLRSQKEILSEMLKGDVELRLDDFDRGWMVWGIVRVPGALDGENFQKVADKLLPWALRTPQIRLAERLISTAERIRNPAPPSLEDLSAREPLLPGRDFAVVAGVSEYDSKAIAPLPAAGKDARDVWGFLVEPDGGGFDPDNIVRLLGGEATAGNFRKALEDLRGAGLRRGDRVFIYVSGYGLVVGGDDGADYTVGFHGAGAGDPANTCVSLGEIEAFLDEAAWADATVVLDAGFGLENRGKSLGWLGMTVRPSRGDLDLEIEPIGNSALVLGSGPGEEGLVLEEEGRSLFTKYFLEGAAGAADADGDGLCRLEEILSYAKDQVERKATLLVSSQTPMLFGNGKRTLFGRKKDGKKK